MANINWDSKLNEGAGFMEPKDPADPAKKISPTDKNTLLHLIWSLTYTEGGRKVLKENRPGKATDPKTPAPTLADAEKNVKKWIADNFSIQDETVVDAVVSAHLAADAWIAARGKDDTVEQARQQKIYQQNIAVVTWMLWEDAMGHEFSMNW